MGEVAAVPVEGLAQSVVPVEHGGDPVKAEAVQMVFAEPVFQVGEQEVEHLMLAVVEELGAPGRVIASGTVVKELPHGAVKEVDALGHIAHGVGVDQVQHHPQSQLMGPVHQVLEVLRRAEPAGGREEVGHLIAEAGVVGVLHHRHQLDGVVATGADPGQRVVGKFPVAADLSLLLGHAHMGLVEEEGRG